MPDRPPTHDSEEDRIRAAYARRGDIARYSLFNPGQLFMVQERERATLTLLRREGFAALAGVSVLEVGCGLGNWLRDFVDWGAKPRNLAGIDFLPDRVARARELCAPGVGLYAASAAQLPFANDSFDIVLQATVFTSILDAAFRRDAAAEMLRVVRPGGIVLWYDFHASNPRNADVRGVARTEIHALFPGCRITLRRITLAPPLARAIAPIARPACTILSRIPVLCTHYLGAIRKPDAPASQ